MDWRQGGFGSKRSERVWEPRPRGDGCLIRSRIAPGRRSYKEAFPHLGSRRGGCGSRALAAMGCLIRSRIAPGRRSYKEAFHI